MMDTPHHADPLSHPFPSLLIHTRDQQDNAGEDTAAGKKAEEGEQPPVDEKAKLIEKLTAENKELKDKVLYTLAEMENVRTIARRDMESAKQFALQSFAKQLLDVADNLSRAIDSVPLEAREKKDNQTSELLATLVQGVEMTDSQLQKVFGANKITKYGSPGDKFDPHLHDALFEYEDAGKEAGSVGQVLKTGYKLNDRVIRPAQVGTVKKT
jgi:molecular chaperone GrpE